MTIPEVRFRAINGVRIRYADGGSSAEVRPGCPRLDHGKPVIT